MSSRRDRPRRPRIIADDSSESDGPDNSNNPADDYRSSRSRPGGRGPPRAPSPLNNDNDRDINTGRGSLAPPRGSAIHTRPRSKVRLQEPFVSSDSDTAARPRDRGGPSRRPRTDLERKTRAEDDMFRSRRDDYTSDEGEALRKSRRGPPRGSRRPERDSDSDPRGGDGNRRGDRGIDPALLAAGGAGGLAGAALPTRSKNPRPRSMDPRGPYPPNDGYDAAPRRPRMRPDYDTDPDGPPMRRRSEREPPLRRDGRGPPPPRYNDDYYDSPSPPRRRGDGGAGRRPPPPYDDRDRGYRSDHGGRRRGDEGYGYGERDQYDRRGGGRARGGGDGYRSDHGPSRRDYYEDDYDGPSRRGGRDARGGGAYGYDSRRDSRYDDDYDRRRSKGGSSSKGKKGLKVGGFKIDEKWQKGATDAFLLYGLPLLKKEGPKWAKQATDLWAKRGG